RARRGEGAGLVPTNIEDHAAGNVRYYGMQIGQVTDVTDPEGLHRVRALIPGIADPSTDWLLPLTIGGGAPGRGGHIVPKVGATVAIFFHQGDPDGHGVYAAMNWGKPDDGSEMPAAAKDETNAEQVQALEIDNLRITVDERAGKRSFSIVDVDPSTGA